MNPNLCIVKSGMGDCLLTARLLLRPAAERDVTALHRLFNEPAVRRYLWDDRPVSREQIRAAIRASVRFWVAILPENVSRNCTDHSLRSWLGCGSADSQDGTERRPQGAVGGDGSSSRPEQPEPVGFCSFRHYAGTEEIEILYAFATRLWGRGLATEAAGAALAHAFEEAGWTHVIALANPANIGSWRVLTRLGLSVEGVTSYNEEPLRRYAISREEWRARQEQGAPHHAHI